MKCILMALTVASLLAGCGRATRDDGPMLMLSGQWVCTSEKYVVLNPPAMECVQYSKLR